MRKIENRFLANYILMFIISIMISILAFILLGFANDVISKTLMKNNYTAKSIMKDDYKNIDTASVTKNGGGIQVINANYEVVLSKGLNTISKSRLTTAEFTEFLTMSKSKDIVYSYSIEYNPRGKFWLIVTFPTSLRIDFAIVHNKEYASVDMQGVVGVIVAVILFYLIMLAVCTLIYSKLTSIGITTPLKKLSEASRHLRDGNYSTRVNLNLENEFGELEDTFNAMASQIEEEISLRKKSEEDRKRLILDISHDLKNPLASIMGYAELCYSRADLSKDEYMQYLKVIYENSTRANNLITDLFELSKMESSEYVLNKTKVDICEYMREQIGSFISDFDKAGFVYDFDIPEKEIILELDRKQMDRVFLNLATNALRYNPEGTEIIIGLIEQEKEVIIVFKDNGIGIPKNMAKDIFKPFVRVDTSRNSRTGGTGLGLSIVEKIITAHRGSIGLKTDENCGCEFVITLPKI